MSNENAKNDLIKEIKGVQIKYIYYVIALNVAAIGYSIHHVKGEAFNWSHYILGGSILFWSLGVYLGFQFVFRFQQLFHITYNWLELYDEMSRKSQVPPSVLNTSVKGEVDKNSHKIQEKAHNQYKWSLFSFYIGCLLFVVWQVFQMLYFIN